MKKIILLIIATSLFVISCSGPQTVAHDETVIVRGFDFTEYTDRGFLFTPELYNGKYKSIGMITVTLWPKVQKRTVVESVPVQGGGYEQKEEEKFITAPIDVEKAIDRIYEKASNMGADAIARFDVTPTSRMNGTLRVQGVEISGFAIKRADD